MAILNRDIFKDTSYLPAFVVFDLDGTLREISHRRHLARSNKWNEFFAACVDDVPVWPVIDMMFRLVDGGHRVEIWSGACESSYDATVDWFMKHTGRDVSELITHMRPRGNYTPDDKLKESWLHAEASLPEMIFDDRQKVVDMWRRNGVVCAQVAPGDFDNEKLKFKPPRRPRLTMMIGPSGAGKSRFIQAVMFASGDSAEIVSSDEIRRRQFPTDDGWCDKEAYTTDGFMKTFGAAKAITKTYLESGIDVVYDATNLRKRSRTDFLKAVGAYDGKNVDVTYVVVNRPLDEKIATLDSSSNRTSVDIIKKHDAQFTSSKSYALKGDGLDHVDVVDMT